MGVLGLVPFLRKKSPHVLKDVPSRFKEFQGKVIAFDATLITQRFHFAPTPHEHRHILGWYRLVQELHENNVRAICIFDGKERNAAKEREAARRRMQRNVTNARGTMEMARLSRLTKLTSLVDSYELLPPEEKVHVSTSLCNIAKDFPAGQHPSDATSELGTDKLEGHLYYPSGDIDVNGPQQFATGEDSAHSILDKTTSDLGSLTITAKVDSELPPTQTVVDQTEESLAHGPSQFDLEVPPTQPMVDQPEGLPAHGPSNSGSESLPAETAVGQAEEPPSGPDLELPPTQTTVDQAEGSLAHGPGRVSTMLAVLYSSFLASVRQMGVLLSPRTVLPRPEDQDDETKITQELSHAQRRLVVEEESIWERLSEVTRKEEIKGDVSFLARELEDKSAKILTSYERRNNPPTSEVYGQCKIILQAMGVPCIDTQGGVEGEALAAAIVRDSIADYVASEDTDVLVYGVPLLRNVTSGTEPLTLIEAQEVRDALDMDSSQFLDFALLLGTDFTDRIRGVGPIRAAKFILSHQSIEKILEGEPKYAPTTAMSDYLQQIRVARAVFQSRPMVPALELLEIREPNEELVLEILERFQLRRFAENEADFSSLLGANYFSDHPYP